ncbi:MAG TPA: hypothetical protein VJ837_01905, partial [Candidatus Paceibacterota bacterium]|nr:hypothetical protein [Candidatus Paceibacterota bacterium]
TSTVVDTIDAEGVDSDEDLDADQLDGSFEGDVHTLRNEGISISLGDTDAVAPVGGDEAQANYEIEFMVEAFGSDFWIEKTTARDATADGSDGVEFVIEDGSGTVYATGTVASSLSSGTESGDNSYGFKVSEGSSRTFTLLVTLDNDGASEVAGFYRTQITGISFDADGVAGGESFISSGLEDYETDTRFVDNDDTAN